EHDARLDIVLSAGIVPIPPAVTVSGPAAGARPTCSFEWAELLASTVAAACGAHLHAGCPRRLRLQGLLPLATVAGVYLRPTLLHRDAAIRRAGGADLAGLPRAVGPGLSPGQKSPWGTAPSAPLHPRRASLRRLTVPTCAPHPRHLRSGSACWDRCRHYRAAGRSSRLRYGSHRRLRRGACPGLRTAACRTPGHFRRGDPATDIATAHWSAGTWCVVV